MKIEVVPKENVYDELSKGTEITVCWCSTGIPDTTIRKTKITPMKLGTSPYQFRITMAEWLRLKIEADKGDCIYLKVVENNG